MKKLLILIFCFSFGFINAQQTVEIPIINGNDDACQNLNTDFTHIGTMFVDTIALVMGHTYEPEFYYYVGLRYQSVPIPPGSTIESAYIQFTPLEANEETHIIWIFCEENANPDEFTNEEFNISDREKFFKNEQWGVSEWEAWASNANSRTHDLKSIVQDVIDLEDWQMNNPIVFLLYGTTTNGAQFPKTAISYEYGAEWYAPLLTITFTAPAGVDEQDLAKALNIFPNPVSEKFTISFEELKEGEYDISIYDLQGKQLHNIHDGWLYQGDHHFELSALDMNMPQGIYLLSISGNKHIVTRKIIVH